MRGLALLAPGLVSGEADDDVPVEAPAARGGGAPAGAAGCEDPPQPAVARRMASAAAAAGRDPFMPARIGAPTARARRRGAGRAPLKAGTDLP
jgi:hypothetical protein